MAEIISLSAIREKRADETEAAKVNWKMGIDQAATPGKSPSHRKSHLRPYVNPYETIQILKRIIELQRQGICLLTQELEGVKRQ